MVEESVVNSVRKFLEVVDRKGIPVSFGVLFGSQVSGRADRWSDIDLLVVSPRFDGARDRKEVYSLWHVAARVDDRIEPIPCGVRQWEEDDASTIVEIARREGIVIPHQRGGSDEETAPGKAL
ncbi:MAG: hypothetical protein GHCLOJNM_02490 [bacterium]|nr:hypothetical protein [bacterium]